MENGNDTQVMVPYVVYRDSIAHDRWVIKGLTIALIITVVLMFASNGLWLYGWLQYDYSDDAVITSVDSEGDGIANFTGGDGGVIYGEGYGLQENTDTDTDEIERGQ